MPKHVATRVKKDNVILSGIGDFLHYYTSRQGGKIKGRWNILYLSSEDKLVGKNQIPEENDLKVVFKKILAYIHSYQAAKIAIFRFEQANVSIPTLEDLHMFSKLQILTHLVDVEIKEYLVLTESSYYSFALHNGFKS